MLTLTPKEIATVLKAFGAKCCTHEFLKSSYRLWLPTSNIGAYLSWLRILNYYDYACDYKCYCDPSAATEYYYIFHNYTLPNLLVSECFKHPDGVMFTCYDHQNIIYQALQLITTE